MGTGKSIATIKDKKNSDIYSIDLSKSGTQLAMGGKDFNVRVFNYETKEMIMELEQGDSTTLGHSNRVYSVKFTDDPNIMVSGGWDNTIFIWDLRIAKSVGYIYGPHVCADSIDVRQDAMLTGSFDKKDILQLWSIENKKLTREITWNSEPHDDANGFVYSTEFDKVESKYILASGRIGVDLNEIRIFNNGGDYELLGKIEIKKSTPSIDFMNTKREFAAGSSNGFVYSFKY